MAQSNLDRTYRFRLAMPSTYDSRPIRVADYLGYNTEKTYGICEPERVGRMILAFDSYMNGYQLQCQPWIGEAPVNFGHRPPLHTDAIYELQRIGGLACTKPFPIWTMYVGSPDCRSGMRPAYLGLDMDGEDTPARLGAVAAATTSGRVLEDHMVCATFPGPNNLTVRIEGGRVREVPFVA